MNETKAVRIFFANALMAVGALITVLCGGCTVLFLASMILGLITGAANHGVRPSLGALVTSGAGATAVVGVFGGLPTAAGVMIFLGGRRMKRRATAPPRRDLDRTFS